MRTISPSSRATRTCGNPSVGRCIRRCWADDRAKRGDATAVRRRAAPKLNVAIGKAEERGDMRISSMFSSRPHLPCAAPMASASSIASDSSPRLLRAQAEPPRSHSITLFEANRALVVCTVTMNTVDGRNHFHNLRLFTRPSSSDPWHLLVWRTNPRISPPPDPISEAGQAHASAREDATPCSCVTVWSARLASWRSSSG